MDTYDILIIGGGFAGVYCGKELAKLRRRNPTLKVGLVAAENYMVFQPMLPEVAAASISPRHVINPIRQLCKGIDVFKGEVKRIDAHERSLRVNAGDFTPDIRIHYRKLVVAAGSQVNLSRVPGMSEHSLLMQNVGDAMKMRSRLISRFEEANLVWDPEKKRQLLSMVVVGGGYSGVETAGETLDLMREIHRYYQNVSSNDFKVTLVHSGDHLLPTLSRKLGDYCERVLHKRGLNIILNQRVKAVTAESVVLDNEERIETNTVVSTVGNAPHPLIVQLADDLGIKLIRGRLPTTPELQVTGCDHVWAAGDCAAVPMKGGNTCPPTAQFAQRQGTRLGRNLSAITNGKQPQPFLFTGLGELAAIGHREAVADIMGISFSGFLAWWMWRTIYVMKLPGLQRKLRVLLDWTFDLFFPRDINLLNPRYSTPLKHIHLEAGDVLFFAGEPAFSVYFVRSGAVEILDGAKLVKRIEPGEYFGERAALDDGIWRYQAKAIDASELVAIGTDEFKAIIHGSRDLNALFHRSATTYRSDDDLEQLKKQLPHDTLTAPAANIMIVNAHTLSVDTSIRDALSFFCKRSHGSYPVLDHDGTCRGVLKRDVLYDTIKGSGLDNNEIVGQLQLGQLPVKAPTTPVAEILETMVRSGRNKVLLCDDVSHQFHGLVTLVDIIQDGLNRPNPPHT